MDVDDIKFLLKLDKKEADRKDHTYFNIRTSNIGKIVQKDILSKYINEHSTIKDCFSVNDLNSLSSNMDFLREASNIGGKR